VNQAEKAKSFGKLPRLRHSRAGGALRVFFDADFAGYAESFLATDYTDGTDFLTTKSRRRGEKLATDFTDGTDFF
jgi:hypothetical protein